MKIIDLTHTISESMPVYPGTEQPKLEQGSSYQEDGFRETVLTLFSHTGTHMDAPNHLYEGRTMLDAFPVSHFVGRAFVVDCSHRRAGESITMEDLSPVFDKAKAAEFLLFYTGWSRFWGTGDYFGDYPCLDFPVLDFLIQTQKKGVGLDTIGIDPIADKNLTRHRLLLESHEIVIIENLANLEQIAGDCCTFLALPLKFEKADGAPVRAIACLGDGGNEKA